MTTTLDDLFATNKTTEEDGAWVDVTPTMKFKIRAFNSKAVTDLREKLLKPFKTMMRAGQDIPAEQNESIGLQVIAGGVLADWKGVPSQDGSDLAYSADNALTTLTRLPRLANFIVGISTDAQFYKDEVVKEALGNSEPR